MKANELMIGDWVNINGDCPMYSVVTSIDQCEIGVCNYLFDAEALTPIPLTPEILEKNGFTLHRKTYILQQNGAEIRWRRTDGYASITAPSNLKLGGFCSITNGYFCYVHILQHALRLCGLNELADNFKVE